MYFLFFWRNRNLEKQIVGCYKHNENYGKYLYIFLNVWVSTHSTNFLYYYFSLRVAVFQSDKYFKIFTPVDRE